VDSDVYPAPDCARRLLLAYEQHGPAVVCPRIVLLPGKDLVQCDGASLYFLGTLALRHAYQPIGGLPDEGRFVGGCIGACLLMRRDLILAAGGFNELFFFYFEDLELSLKLRARGHRMFCEPRAIAYHEQGVGTPGLSYRGAGSYPARRAYLSMRHRWLAMLIHYRARTLMILGPALGLYELGTLGFALRRGWLGAWGSAWIWLIRNRREIRKHRRVAQATRTTSDRELLEAGPIPVAPGLLRSEWSRRAAGVFSRLFQGYWAVVRGLAG
jgi:GT2 family glycosyltransferase